MEEPQINHKTGTVTFSRKVSVKQYESAEASIFVQFDIPTEGTPDEQRAQLLSNARAAFWAAKALVFEELGLPFSVEEGGVIREVLQSHVGRVTEVVPSGQPAPAPALAPAPEGETPFPSANEVGPNPPFSTDTQDKAERIANKKWAIARIKSHPNEWWDNRDNKRNPKAPDYKHKDNGMGVWL